MTRSSRPAVGSPARPRLRRPLISRAVELGRCARGVLLGALGQVHPVGATHRLSRNDRAKSVVLDEEVHAPQLRILYLVNGLNRGGGERMLADLVQVLRTRAHIRVYTLTRLGAVAKEMEALGVPVECLRWCGCPLPWRWLGFLLQARQAHLLHTHFFYSDLTGALTASLLPRVRLVSTKHETGFWMRGHHVVFERLALRRFVAILCVSRAVLESLTERGVPPEKLYIAPPGVRNRCLESRRARDCCARIVSVGRLEPVKGHEVLLRAARRLAGLSPAGSWELILVGDGSARKALESLAAELGVQNRVRFAGMLAPDEVARELAEADLFVLPSRAEGLPLALLEAAAAGLACVATHVGGIPEVIEEGVSGLLVPPDDEEALATQLARLIADPSEAARLGQGASEKSRRFYGDEQAAAERVWQIYQCLLGSWVDAGQVARGDAR